MITAKEAYALSKVQARQSKDWQYLEERIALWVDDGCVQTDVSFDHNPQTCMLMLQELGYVVTPKKIDKAANYYSFTISWFKGGE